jgi:hypothetical protein
LLGLLLLDESLAQDDHETIQVFRISSCVRFTCVLFDAMISVLPQEVHAISPAADRPKALPLARAICLADRRRGMDEAKRVALERGYRNPGRDATPACRELLRKPIDSCYTARNSPARPCPSARSGRSVTEPLSKNN